MQRHYKQDKLVGQWRVGLLVSEWVSDKLVNELVQYIYHELLLSETGSWSQKPEARTQKKANSTVGSHYQKTGEDTAGWGDLNVWYNEL
jgi:hypothetical protein